MTRSLSHWITLAGLVLLGLLMALRIAGMQPASARIAVALLALLPIAVLVLTSLRGDQKWGTWAAVWMIPYFAVAVGELLIQPLTPVTLAWPALTVVVFFAGLDASRRRII
ncbi:MAG: hypothetical protein JJT85_04140 [Chromatiales bacterium]|nr:hypothetical protein [Chromatiales bacterium]